MQCVMTSIGLLTMISCCRLSQEAPHLNLCVYCTEALLSAETQAMEPEEEDEEMLEASAEAAPAQVEPAPALRPASKPGGLAKRRRR